MTELVLLYVEAQSIENYLAWAKKAFDHVVVADLEYFNTKDSVGQEIVQDYLRQKLSVPGFVFYETLDTIKNNYNKLGYDLDFSNMEDIQYKYVDPKERQRIEKIESFDDLQKRRQWLEHYFVSLARSSRPSVGSNDEEKDVIAGEIIRRPSTKSMKN